MIGIICQKIDISIYIREALFYQDIILIPDSTIYESDLFYDNHILDRLRRQKAIDPFDRTLWVYHDYDPKTGKIDKRSIHHLENKHYVAAFLSIPYESHWKSPKEVKEKEMYTNFMNFLKGVGPQPILKEIVKKNRIIGDEDKYDLIENIENSITLHWIYIHKNRLEDFIDEYV